MDKEIRTLRQLKDCVDKRRTSFYCLCDKGTKSFLTVDRGFSDDDSFFVHIPLAENWVKYSPDEFTKMYGAIMKAGKFYCKKEEA